MQTKNNKVFTRISIFFSTVNRFIPKSLPKEGALTLLPILKASF